MREAGERTRIAVVTGGDGGIGREIAERLTSDGCTVVRADMSFAQDDPDAGTFHVDVREPDSCERLLANVASRYGGLDILVNNAGVMHRGTFAETSAGRWRDVLAVNLDGVASMCRAAHQYLTVSAPACVVNMSSTHALRAVGGVAAYGVSKAAVVQLTRVLAHEWGGDGIRVNAVAPTIVPTAMNADVRADEHWYEAKLASIPMGRAARAGDVADVVSYLTSGGADFVTGQTFAIDGGETL